MIKSAKELYAVPDWMSPYLPLFHNTGGNDVEELLHDEDTNMFANGIRYMLIASVRSQFDMLVTLHKQGIIATQTSAVSDVLLERKRQLLEKGFSTQQDDTYIGGELAAAAISYIEPMEAESYWPADWHDDSFKPTHYRRNLVKATALLLAELERLDRQEAQ